MDPKQRAAEAALEHVRDGTVIGLGTGSTAELFLVVLADALKSGRRRDVTGVPTSERTERRARELAIPLTTLAHAGQLDLDVDGADEVSPSLDLIKGLGGALLREKIVAQSSRSMIVIADASKRVEKLGTRSPLPVEVAKFEHEATAAFLESLGCRAVLRRSFDGAYVTDNGNYIYDCRFERGIGDPALLNLALSTRAGVVETGLFLGMAKVAIIAGADGVDTLKR
ncbi:MAG TPA: ribose-5-phosphate isomerase RpiA [Tepidisphaeraceae bacterium]|nr:ribose-5-phosphate isomerase RpiA [Tepidisphaeraceae bacterium]